MYGRSDVEFGHCCFFGRSVYICVFVFLLQNQPTFTGGDSAHCSEGNYRLITDEHKHVWNIHGLVGQAQAVYVCKNGFSVS